MTYFITQFINGLQIGAIYALIALGYTMVYGIIKLINFAHGDLMMVGAYIAFFALSNWGLPIYLAAAVSMVGTAILGVVIDRIAYKPLRDASRLSALITAIAVSLLLQNACMLLFSSSPRRFPTVTANLPTISIGNSTVNVIVFISIALAIALMIILNLFVNKTRIGKAMLAVSEDMRAAQLMGINVDFIVSLTFAIGSALAAFAAVLYLFSYPQIEPYMGAMPGIKAFIAAVLGGIGIIPGAMVGGFLLGIIESMAKAYIPSAFSQVTDAVVFLVLILVLLIKPSGLMGKPEKVKV
ncbi:MAG: branched-chain amino acid ABC transporter permease [Oscillospiraceae bacterium]|nr:branched-chain amino acid ABC transporter permease [Oscillospiraceae bacterium]MDD4368014.1 branched-chain amino acid ABC transporter permease [Oscillospiraceae bacterium]